MMSSEQSFCRMIWHKNGAIAMFMSISQKHLNMFGCKNKHIVMCPYQYAKTLQYVHLTNYTKVLSL